MRTKIWLGKTVRSKISAVNAFKQTIKLKNLKKKPIISSPKSVLRTSLYSINSLKKLKLEKAMSKPKKVTIVEAVLSKHKKDSLNWKK